MPRRGSMIINIFLRSWQEWNTTLVGWDAGQNSITQLVFSAPHIICIFNDLSTWSMSCCAVAQLCPRVCDPMDCGTPGFSVLHYLPEFDQMDVHRVGDAIQPSHPLSSLSPPAFNLSQHQGLFQWIDSSHQVATVLELQLQHRLLRVIAIFAYNSGFVYLSLHFYHFLPQVSYCEIL